ncbi:60S ribosomal subunit assembly export protein loc-1 [Lasiosphaeria ovina]|uniref:60S ribosomal subunit assembly export protein loc-1 n=1 Tax=Lasiosphaeria ovina TaxID=92902 RepID=A0AAE0N8V3_9PEZI|nr:60S ribosomal subunit assembly export protein loc-1 [Lasiosphaeria ovina]
MAPTRTIKNKHAANGSGIKGSKQSKNPKSDGGVIKKSKNNKSNPAHASVTRGKGRPNIAELLHKKKKRVYTAKELGLPELNMVTPVGVQKPRGKKKGKVFIDDRESMNTILAIVQAEKEGQIESKLIKARQMEEIREARKAEADAKEAERHAKFDETKDSLRKKRRKPRRGSRGGGDGGDGGDVKSLAATGTNATKLTKKRVSFAAE